MRSLLLPAATLLALAGNLHAQAQTSVNQQRLTTVGRTGPGENVPTLTLATNGRGEEFAPWSPGSTDLGEQRILKRQDEYEAFSFSAAAAGYLTNNVALVSAGEQDDAFMVTTLVAAWRPRLTRRLYGELSITQQMYRYEEYGVLDFQSLEPAVGLTYLSDWLGGMSFLARYTFTQYTDRDWDSFNETHALALAAQKPFIYSRGLWFYVGAGAKLGLDTDPEIARRHEYGVQAGMNASLARWLELQIYARSSVFDYPEYGRVDFNQIIGANLNFKACEQLTASVFASAAFNRSDDGAFDYDVFNPGVGVALNLRF